MAEPPAPAASRPRRRPRPLAVAIVLAVLLALVGIAVVAAGRLFGGPGGPDFAGPGAGSVVIEVRPGQNLSDVGRTLQQAGVVKSEAAFRAAANASPQARSLQPGWYQLRERMSAKSALALLLDPGSRMHNRVAVPEGSRVSAVFDLVAKNTAISRTELEAAAAKPAALGLPPYAGGRLEGFLFPATYDFEPGTTAVQALAAMVGRFDQEARDLGLEAAAAQLGRSPYEVVTVASLVEWEAKLPEDYGRVARVTYNRLLPQWGKPLGYDSTLTYAFPDRKGRLGPAELGSDSPYNSRRRVGLPPTPVNSPGRAALEAALRPPPGPWVYFVTIDSAGHNAFSSTFEEFQRDVATARARGVQGVG